MGVSSLRLEPRFGGVFSCLPRKLGGIADNRRERVGSLPKVTAGNREDQARGARAANRCRLPASNHIRRAGNGFSGTIAAPVRWCVSVPRGVGAMAVVLIVEDEEQVRVLAEAIIRELGHET